MSQGGINNGAEGSNDSKGIIQQWQGELQPMVFGRKDIRSIDVEGITIQRSSFYRLTRYVLCV